jgi:hypothetical protein
MGSVCRPVRNQGAGNAPLLYLEFELGEAIHAQEECWANGE